MPTRVRRITDVLRRRLNDAVGISEIFVAATEVLASPLGAKGAGWSTVDPATMLGTSCFVVADFGDGLKVQPNDAVREQAMFESEWIPGENNTFSQIRDSDRYAAGLRHTAGESVSSVPRFVKFLAPMGASDELRALLMNKGEVWGTVVFYRFDAAAFGDSDIDVLEQCSAILGTRIRCELLRSACDHPGLPSPPGIVQVDADNVIVTTTSAAETLLGELSEEHAATALRTLAISMRSGGPASTRVLGSNAALMMHAMPTKGADDLTTVVIERPRPAQMSELVLLAADLSHREREIASLVLQGLPTKVIARRLSTAPDTVGKQLQAIYRKVGVVSRAELCATVFADSYLPHWSDGSSPSPYGGFLQGRADPENRR